MDADLVTRAKQGDEQAFASIVEAIGESWLGVAQRILYDAQLAEDATQQALVKLWRHLPGLRDPARFDAWSYRLLVKACYSEGGRRRRWLSGISSLTFDQPTASDDVATVIDRDQLERGLRRISVDHRTVLVLRYYVDLPLEAVAAALDVPFGTVSSRLSRAHDALRGVLEADARTSPHPSPSEATR